MTTWLEYERVRNPHPDPVELPVRFQNARYPDLWAGTPLQVGVQRYCADIPGYVTRGVAPCLLGRARTGKTLAAAVVARAVSMGCRIDTAWCSVPSEFPALHMTQVEDATKRRIERLCSVPFLVIDDIGVITPNSFGHALLTRIIAQRFDTLRPTLITGNLELVPGDEWGTVARLYGPLLQRRFQEGAEGFTLLLS